MFTERLAHIISDVLFLIDSLVLSKSHDTSTDNTAECVRSSFFNSICSTFQSYVLSGIIKADFKKFVDFLDEIVSVLE